MKRLMVLVLALVAVAACSNPTAPVNPHGDCVPVVYGNGDTLWVIPGTVHSAPECHNK